VSNSQRVMNDLSAIRAR